MSVTTRPITGFGVNIVVPDDHVLARNVEAPCNRLYHLEVGQGSICNIESRQLRTKCLEHIVSLKTTYCKRWILTLLLTFHHCWPNPWNAPLTNSV